MVTQSTAHRTIYQVLHHSGKPVQYTASYGVQLESLWGALSFQQERIKFFSLQLSTLQCEFMLAITAAWTWLEIDIPSLAYGLLYGKGMHLLVSRILLTHKSAVKPTEQHQWIAQLLKDIRQQLGHKTRTPLRSSDYLALSAPKEYQLKYRGRLPGEKNGAYLVLVSQLRNVLQDWLNYPQNQGRIQSAFIRGLLESFRTPDVLLLPGVFEGFQQVRKTVLPGTAVRGSRLQVANLTPFTNDLRAHPLAKLDSEESKVMAKISEHLEILRNMWRSIGSGVSGGVSCEYFYFYCHCLLIFVSVSPAYPLDSEEFDHAMQSAAKRLTIFLKELLPLLSPPLPSPLTPLQQRVNDSLDFLLPFRQHAPEVRNALKPHGCLHPTNIDKEGAIASLWCWRGIFYRTRFSSENPERLLFPSFEAWDALYKELCADSNISSFNQHKDRYFCNARAYGQATTRSTKNAKTYFDNEHLWLALFDDQEPGWKMSYKDAFLFTQQKDRTIKKILPQLGPLTGMLITADLVYAGKVAMPSAEEMGSMVHLLDKGADACLQSFRLLDRSSSEDTTVTVFKQLYDLVYQSLTDIEHTTMTYDPIMFEHALCKYQRCNDT